ncbi:MAG: hypothetical protein LIO46_04240 [Clostridiales bacterium]|nr:hypothetical protein [Clostridiales bacterium]
MTLQEKKNWLMQYRDLEADIRRKRGACEAWREKANRLTACVSDMPSVGPGADRVQYAVESICRLEQEIRQLVRHQANMKQLIETQLDALPDVRWRLVLEYRYLDGMKWDEISHIMGYDIEGKNVYKIHRKALEALVHEGEAAREEPASA